MEIDSSIAVLSQNLINKDLLSHVVGVDLNGLGKFIEAFILKEGGLAKLNTTPFYKKRVFMTLLLTV
jgi:hypothetical protein